MTKKVEIEIKLRVKDPAEIPVLLPRLGARLLHPREFEDNQLFDFPGRLLQKAGKMLRVRVCDRGTLLTYKEGARVADGAKVRDEMEVTVDQGGTLTAILTRLGMAPTFRYQKYRTTYQYGDLLVTVDETPIGTYLELEGPKPMIDEMAKKLGYSASDYVLGSYRDLFAAEQGGQDRDPGDMLFHA